MSKSYLDEILSSIENCKIESTFSCEKIADCMANYVQLIQKYIQKEENDYFPLTNKIVTGDVQMEISNQFKLINDVFCRTGYSDPL